MYNNSKWAWCSNFNTRTSNGSFFGLGIDNAIVEVNAEEIPILDGSAKIFVNEILKAGIKISEVPIKVIRINEKIDLLMVKRKFQ